MEKIYVDTHIFADYWGDRSDNKLPLGEFAFRLFKETMSCKFLILFSKQNSIELKSGCKIYDLFEIDLMSDLLSADKLLRIPISEQQKQEAKKISLESQVPKGDALHAILARDNDAILVSRDKHHYLVDDLVTVRKPEDLI